MHSIHSAASFCVFIVTLLVLYFSLQRIPKALLMVVVRKSQSRSIHPTLPSFPSLRDLDKQEIIPSFPPAPVITLADHVACTSVHFGCCKPLNTHLKRENGGVWTLVPVLRIHYLQGSKCCCCCCCILLLSLCCVFKWLFPDLWRRLPIGAPCVFRNVCIHR